MSEPWQIYLDEFRRHAGRVPEQRFSRDDAFAEAAHRAYQTTADRLSTVEGWDDDSALLVTHAFGQAVKDWMARPGYDWDALAEALRRRQAEARPT